MARMQEGGFYGWPWYTIGANEDPALKGKRPDLKSEVRVPEVLIQAHSSALSVAFYDREAFPAEYLGCYSACNFGSDAILVQLGSRGAD
jgi:glucose/arabinose dehydrogenase